MKNVKNLRKTMKFFLLGFHTFSMSSTKLLDILKNMFLLDIATLHLLK